MIHDLQIVENIDDDFIILDDLIVQFASAAMIAEGPLLVSPGCHVPESTPGPFCAMAEV
jgi:hypothetical protein